MVCDEQHQDKFVPINKTDKGIVNVYTSTKNGKRLEKTQVKFSQVKEINDSDTNTWHVKIDRSKNYQKIIGFGTAFTDSAVLNVGNMTSKLQRQILEDMFSENGFEYSVVRTTIAGSDMSTRPYTYDDVEDDYNLTYFNLVEEDIKYKVSQLFLL